MGCKQDLHQGGAVKEGQIEWEPSPGGPRTDARWGSLGLRMSHSTRWTVCVGGGSFLEGVSRVEVMVRKSSSLETKFVQS